MKEVSHGTSLLKNFSTGLDFGTHLSQCAPGSRGLLTHQTPRGYRDLKKRPRVDFFGEANLAGLTNLHNQAHFQI